MADYVVTLTGKDNLSPTIKNVKKELESVGGAASQIDKIETKFKKITSSAAPLKKQMRELKAIMAEMNLNGLSGTDTYTQIAQEAGRISDAMGDASASVKRFADDTFSLTAAADAMQMVAGVGSVATGAMALFGKENENVQKAILKVQSALAILNGVQAIANKLNKDSALMQKIKQIRLTASTAATATNTAATAGNTAIQTANTVGIAANTVATTANTIAQNAWNAAKAIGKALFGDFTGLIILGIGALTTYAMTTSDAADAEEERNKALDEGNSLAKERSERESSMASSIANAASTQLAAYVSLQKKWNECGSDVKKQEVFMSQYKDEINKTGFAVNSLSDCENLFVRNTKAVVDAIMARAEAQANYEMMVDTLKKGIEKANQSSVESGKYYKKATADNLTNVEEMILANKHLKKDKQGIDYINKLRERDARERQKQWKQNAIDDATAQAQAYADGMQQAATKAERIITNAGLHTPPPNNTPPRNGSGGHNTPTPVVAPHDDDDKPQEGSIESMTKKVQELQKQLKYGLVADVDVSKVNTEIKKLQSDIQNKEIELGLKEPKEPDAVEGSVASLQKKVKDLQDKLDKGLIPEQDIRKTVDEMADLNEQIETAKRNIKVWPKFGTVDFLKEGLSEIEKELSSKNLDVETRIRLNARKDEIQKQIDEKTKGKVSIEAIVKPSYIESGTPEDYRQSYENAQARIQQIQTDFQHGIKYTREQANEAIRVINEQLKSLGMKPITIHIKTKFENINDMAKAGIGGISAIDGSVDKVVELTKAIDENKNAWEIWKASVGVVESILNTITTVITTVNTLKEIYNAISGKGAASNAAEAASATTAATAEQAKAAVDMETIGAATAATVALKTQEAAYLDLAAAAIFAAHASIPFAGVGIAAGMISTMMGAMAAQSAASSALAAFANGGIVGGSSYHGDKLLARINSGEMVLNGKQQANLFKAIDSGKIGNDSNSTPQLTFRVKGSDLYAALRNYSKVKSKSGITTGIQ